MRQLCWIVLAAPALLGQISDYAINGNGDATYLVTNWRLRGQPDTGERRLFRIGEGAPQLVAAQPAAGFASVLVGDGEKVVLVVTTNGNRMAITGAALTAAQTQALSQLPSSSVGLSPNGRYLYRYAGCSDGAVIRYDLTKPPSDWSRRFAYPDVRPGSCPNWVASFRPDNQGREVMYLPSRGAIQVQDDSGARDLSFPLGQGLGSVQLVPGRNELLVTTDTADSAERRFLRVNLTTGQEQEVYRMTNVREPFANSPGFFRVLSTGFPLGMSSDGQRVVFWVDTTGVAKLVVCDGTPARCAEVTPPDRVLSFDLNDRATHLAYRTLWGSLKTLELATGVARTVVPPTPGSVQDPGTAVPGSSITFTRTGFSMGSEPGGSNPPWRTSWDGEPIALRFGRGAGWIQIPWEANPGVHRLAVDAPASPFAPVEVEVMVRDVRPAVAFPGGNVGDGSGAFPAGFIRAGQNQPAPFAFALREDFSGEVTTVAPARGGEVVHLYWTGLGPVTAALATGAAGPGAELARVVRPITCVFDPAEARIPVETLFQGLAPGLIGIYQMDLRVPPQVPGRDGNFWCGTTPAPAADAGDQFRIPVSWLP